MSYYLRYENKGFGLEAPSGAYPIARFDVSRPWLVGSDLFAVGRCNATQVNFLKKPDGTDAPFYIDQPRLMVTSGEAFIRHAGIVVSGYGDEYPIYANVRLHLAGPYANDLDIPALNWSAPLGPMVMMRGRNINGVSHHYAGCPFTYQQILQPGWYRLAAYAASGSSASDVDGLGEIAKPYASTLNQFFLTIH